MPRMESFEAWQWFCQLFPFFSVLWKMAHIGRRFVATWTEKRFYYRGPKNHRQAYQKPALHSSNKLLFCVFPTQFEHSSEWTIAMKKGTLTFCSARRSRAASALGGLSAGQGFFNIMLITFSRANWPGLTGRNHSKLMRGEPGTMVQSQDVWFRNSDVSLVTHF